MVAAVASSRLFKVPQLSLKCLYKCEFIYLFYLFKKYLKRVTQLAVSASLPCGPLHIKINTLYIYMFVHIYTNNNS